MSNPTRNNLTRKHIDQCVYVKYHTHLQIFGVFIYCMYKIIRKIYQIKKTSVT